MSALQRVAEAVASRAPADLGEQMLVSLAAASISADQREEWRKKGYSLPDGSFPIPNVAYLHKAMSSFGRCPPDKRNALRAHIKKRAKELGVDISDSKIVAASVIGGPLVDTAIIGLAFGGKKAPPFGKKADGDAEDQADQGADEGSETEDDEVSKLSPAQRKKYDAMRKKGMPHGPAMKACGGK